MDQAGYLQARAAHWDKVACGGAGRSMLGGYYHRRLQQVYAHVVPAGLKVLEIGCGRGDLLAAVKPALGVGVDLSPGMIEAARATHQGGEFRWLVGRAENLPVGETFDVVILSDLLGEMWDIQEGLVRLREVTGPQSRVVLNFYSKLWELPLKMARGLGLATPVLEQNWLTPEDVRGLLELAGFEPLRHWREMICPVQLAGLQIPLNRWVGKLWPLEHLAVTNFMAARRRGVGRRLGKPTVSVVVPARNEAGNIAAIMARVPRMGGGTEVIFVEGNSTDDTYQTIAQVMAGGTVLPSRLFKQTGKGKGDAVRLGFAEAKGDILMILDADMTVAPEDLPRFYEALAQGAAEFANGVRLVYPMEKEAMRFLNLLGNKFFAQAFTWMLGQPVKDSLCGTKVLWREDYARIVAGRKYFGDFDPFGDFDLLFGAARLHLKIVDIPVRYHARTYGETNIQRFRHGLLLLRMVMFAARRIKFV